MHLKNERTDFLASCCCNVGRRVWNFIVLGLLANFTISGWRHLLVPYNIYQHKVKMDRKCMTKLREVHRNNVIYDIQRLKTLKLENVSYSTDPERL